MEPETQELWSSTGTAPEAGKETAKAGLSADSTPWSLAPYILVLLLLVALAESVVANRYLRSSIHTEEVKA
jgi:hypothetical protein